MTEQFINNANTTLNGSIDNVTTTVTVTNGTPFSTSGTFRILIDSEIMIVNSRSGNVFSVQRGQESTVAASHSNGATVSQIITAGAIGQLKTDTITQAWPITWITTQTTNYTVQSTDQSIPVDTTSGAVTITLPASPSDGERHMIADVAGTANVNAISISGNGHNIVGLSTYIMTGPYNVLEVAYHAGKGVWMIV